MKLYKKESKQLVDASLEECWHFFSDPSNLQKITPATMGFQVTDFDQKKMYQGQIIAYKISPLLGIKMSWVTEITTVRDKEFFIDEQRFGPYSFWHHKHYFEETPQGTLMTDVVHYGVPLGFIGRIMNSLVIEKQLETIFKYRHQKVEQLFNKK
ncbi:SRPBCC family protein [Flavobacterium sp. TMP13]|uniref:SRPBCC family protein n=1 Tax=unclassified Flavobacterium TaxID=196869 RepID=UPI00076CD32C|nr:SRPBCC family protein [Flavobacterium sp. TAB 87]KVV15346.1 hypothetical protein AP058_01012 [Flavobacterium sp. TAB 87]